jgi:hypothetical protein
MNFVSHNYRYYHLPKFDFSFWVTLYIIILYMMDVNLNVEENNVL